MTQMMEQNQDAEHLQLLSIFHYVVAGIAGLCAMLPIVHLTIGILMLLGMLDDHGPGKPPTAFIGWFLIIPSATMMAIGFTMSICIALAGRRLARNKSYTYCLVMAGIECIFMPFGTVLGVFTILVLQRPSVKAMFAEQRESTDNTTPAIY